MFRGGMRFRSWFFSAGLARRGTCLSRYGGFVALGLVLVLAAVCGLAGGAIIFLFLTKVLLPHERELDRGRDGKSSGAVGRVSAGIRAGGTGEIVYEQLGARCSAPARSETAIRFKDRKRSLSSATKKESPTSGAGKTCWKSRELENQEQEQH
jgi:hypothetical protein